jgi:hypothetical protein
MRIKEAVELLGLTREGLKIAITKGIELPLSKEVVRLDASPVGSDYDIDESSLDSFIARFHKEEPGRHPPIGVRRKLLVESRHRCAICREMTPIVFHHMIEFSSIKHYDLQNMLALCPNCHTLCTQGAIDLPSQYQYKENLLTAQNDGSMPGFTTSVSPANFSWDDLRQIITVLHDAVIASGPSQGESKFDFSGVDLDKKNELNRLSEEYFKEVVLEHHEPYFNRIDSFLKAPVNKSISDLYHEIVDELRSKIAANRKEFEYFDLFLTTFADAAVKSLPSGTRLNRRALNILLSFMYVNCDIGRKQ